MRFFIATCAVVFAMVGAPYAGDGGALTANRDANANGSAAAKSRKVIAVIGDSMARSYCRGLAPYAKAMASVEILCWTKPSSGLTRVDFFDWNMALNGHLEQRVPDAAIVSMGANDAQGMVYNKKVLNFASDGWTEVYGARVSQFIETLSTRGARVYWVGMPMARSERYSRRMKHLNKVYARTVEGRSQTFLSLWSLTQDKNGKFTMSMRDPAGRSRVARMKDGIHFTGDGERIVACYLLNTVLPQIGVKEAPKGCRANS